MNGGLETALCFMFVVGLIFLVVGSFADNLDDEL